MTGFCIIQRHSYMSKRAVKKLSFHDTKTLRKMRIFLAATINYLGKIKFSQALTINWER